MAETLVNQVTKSLKVRWKTIGVLSMFSILALTACGTDFPEPKPASASEPTPPAQATVFRTIQVTPAPTNTPVPLEEGEFYSGVVQRPFPPEIDGAGTKTPLPAETVLSLWEGYLSNAHVVIEQRQIDMHLCDDGRIIPGGDSGMIRRGGWGLRQSNGDWYEAEVGRQFGRGRLASIARLSRNGGRTVASNDGIVLVSVSDSDKCGD